MLLVITWHHVFVSRRRQRDGELAEAIQAIDELAWYKHDHGQKVWRHCQRCYCPRENVLETGQGEFVCGGCWDVRTDADMGLLESFCEARR